LFILSSLLLQACSSDNSDKIEGIKWTDNYSKLGSSKAYTSFMDGKVKSCVPNEKQWRTVTRYELNGSKLSILPEGRDTRKKTFNMEVKGSGDERVLIMTSHTGKKTIEMKFPISTSSDCPIK
jgi:hypothetical protein